MFASLVGKKETVEFPVEKGADISVQNESGNTASSLAEQQGADEVASILRKKNEEALKVKKSKGENVQKSVE